MTCTATRDHEGDLGVMQLADSMFPAGLFAASNGIESMFRAGDVTTARGIADIIRTGIEQQLGPGDCVMLAAAHAGAAASDRAAVAEADALCHAMRPARESRDAAARSGAQLARCVGGFAGGGMLGWYRGEVESGGLTGVHPVSLGVCCHALGIGAERAALVLLYGFAAGSAGAALRLGIIQHYEAQGIIHGLKPAMARAAAGCVSAAPAEAWQFAPQAEIYQMAHEQMDSRMFIT